MFYATISRMTIPKQMSRVLHEVNWKDPTIRYYLVQANNSNRAKEYRNFVAKMQRATETKIKNVTQSLEELNSNLFKQHLSGDHEATLAETRYRFQTISIELEHVAKKMEEIRRIYLNDNLKTSQNWLSKLEEQKNKYKVKDPVYLGWLKGISEAATKYEDGRIKSKKRKRNL